MDAQPQRAASTMVNQSEGYGRSSANARGLTLFVGLQRRVIEPSHYRPISGTDKPRQIFRASTFGNLLVTRDGFRRSGRRVRPKRVAPALPLQVAPVAAKVLQERVQFHAATSTVVRSASDGTPRKPSSRRSSRISAMASERLLSASSRVRPLSVGTGDLRGVGDEPILVSLNDGGELVLHGSGGLRPIDVRAAERFGGSITDGRLAAWS